MPLPSHPTSSVAGRRYCLEVAQIGSREIGIYVGECVRARTSSDGGDRRRLLRPNVLTTTLLILLHTARQGGTPRNDEKHFF